MSTPVINFVHANGFPAGSYQTFFDAFPKQYNVIAHDQFGHDPDYPVENNLQSLVDELVNFLKQQNQKVIGIGHSVGGVISFIAACQHPELFRGLILLDPPAFTGIGAWMMKLAKKTPLIDKLTPAGQVMIRRRYWPKGSNLIEKFQHKPLFKNFDPRCMEDYISHGFKENEEQIELIFSPLVEASIYRSIPSHLSRFKNKLSIPSALIYGEKSDLAPASAFKRFAKQNNITLKIMANGGHMFPLEQPEATAEMIKGLISKW
jgi:pimeloyl-ACP methyl ester carboxylesterase